MKMRSPLPLTLALLASGCAALPPMMTSGATERAPQAAAAVKTGTVVVDVKQLLQYLSDRHVLADGFNTTGITNLRLEARGPGMDTVKSGNMTFTNPPSGSLTLEVPQGVNRIFRLQGVDADGNVLVSLATVAEVPSTAAVPLTFNLATTATANVLRRLVDPIETGMTDASGIRNLVTTQDITADLKAYVLKATLYDASTKAVGSGGIDPRFFRADQMAALLYKKGLTEIQAKKSTASPDAEASIQVDGNLNRGTAGKLFVAIRNKSGLPITSDATVKGELFDLGRSGNISTTASGTDDSGALSFDNVNIGWFDLKLTLPDGTVTWLHDVNVRDTGASYTTYSVPSTATSLPQGVNLNASKVAIAENGSNHDLLLAWVDDSSNAHIQEFDTQGLPKGSDIQLSSPSGCNSIAATYVPGATSGTDAYMVSWVTGGGSEVNVGALKPAATALAKSTVHTASSAYYGIQIVPLGTQDVAVVWADGSNVNLAKDSWDGANLTANPSGAVVSTGDTQNAVAAGSSTSNLLLAWNNGTDIVSQRTSLSSGGTFDLSGSPLTVASNSAPCGSSISVNQNSLMAAYDSSLNQYLVGWGTTTSDRQLAYKLQVVLQDGKGTSTSKLSFRSVTSANALGVSSFDVNRSDAKLETPKLAYTSAKSEYLLAYVNKGTNAVQAQRIPAGLTSLPSVSNLFSTATDSNAPSNPAFAYSSSSGSYRTIWFVPGVESSSGPVTLGEYKP